MGKGLRKDGWRGRKRWAWCLFVAAWVAMGVGLFCPSYGTPLYFKSASGEDSEMTIHLGWECAWTVAGFWEMFFDGSIGSIGSIGYEDSLILSYLPINALFVIAGLFLWLSGRSRRLSWVFRVVYALLVMQVLSWWLLHVLDDGRSEEVLIGYWFWLGAYVLLAWAFWVMPGVGREEGKEGCATDTRR